jgi:hypothetical protein
VRLNHTRFSALSSHLTDLCAEARETTFSSEHELRKILQLAAGRQPTPAGLLIEETAAYESAAQCADVGSTNPRYFHTVFYESA